MTNNKQLPKSRRSITYILFSVETFHQQEISHTQEMDTGLEFKVKIPFWNFSRRERRWVLYLLVKTLDKLRQNHDKILPGISALFAMKQIP